MRKARQLGRLGLLTALLTMGVAMSLAAATIGFDDVSPGGLPEGWLAGVTGSGSPKWAVARDDTAPSRPNVLAQTGAGTFPFCVDPRVSLADGFVEVKFKPISGREDQAGGIKIGRASCRARVEI